MDDLRIELLEKLIYIAQQNNNDAVWRALLAEIRENILASQRAMDKQKEKTP